MKIRILVLTLSLFGIANLWCQTAADPNEGSKLEYDSVNSTWRFKWWGRAGTTYFIQHTEDLQTWNWVPIVEPGDDSIKEWGFTSTATKFFWRLKYHTGATQDPNGDDFDGDGIGNLAEVEQGLDPLRWDSDGDGLSDLLEIASGANPTAHGQPVGTVGLFVYLGGNK